MNRKLFLFTIILIISNTIASCNFIQEENNDRNKTVLLPFSTNGKSGYINMQGGIVIEPTYEYTGFFTDGLAPVKEHESFGYIDKNNKMIISPKYSFASEFSYGYASVSTGDPGAYLWGFIDKKGYEIVKPQFVHAEDFTPEGYAFVILYKDQEYVNAMVNTEGEIILLEDYEIISSFSDGYATIKKEGKYGFIDTEFNIVIQPTYTSVGSFSEGYAFAEDSKGRYIIDKNGDIVKKAEHIFGPFSQGLAVVKIDDKFGYMDKEGKLFIEPKYDRAFRFYNGLARVQLKTEDGYKWGFIDTKGNVIIEPIYDDAEDFVRDVIRAKINKERKYYIIDKNGKIIYSSGYPDRVEPTYAP